MANIEIIYIMCIKFIDDLWQLLFREMVMNSFNLNIRRRALYVFWSKKQSLYF